ncbi:hypothetical protein V5O48_018078 [Marasmius crinis-equi]|uniref:Heterokaryon incompatibility domain-containing protein n=1 Tax=Marasmius crinis-equi TaxID=585013 RepID=A0ABR3EM64_9AGAR
MQRRLGAIIRGLCACSCIGTDANQHRDEKPDAVVLPQSNAEIMSTQQEDPEKLPRSTFPTSHGTSAHRLRLEATRTYEEKVQAQGGQLIFCMPIQDIRNTTLDIAEGATPRRFRLVDCYRLIHEDELCIYEFEQIPAAVSYAAVSYVWQGNPLSSDWEEELGTFSIKGAEDGDPISLDVLESVGKAISLGLQFVVGPFLWLDRLCILQTDKSDKAWQISHMHQIYKSCMVCVVLPGGIGHLVRLDEETGWIHRGWTLQEALVPEKVVVLFLFSRNFFDEGDVVDKVLEDCENCDKQNFAPLQRGEQTPHPYLKVMKKFGRAAWIPLDTLLESALDNIGWEMTNMPPPDKMSNNPSILGGYTECELLQMARTASTASYEGRQEWREQAIWRASFIRTSSRPVDMVFSIMQLFGINLDTTKFEKDDRLGATIALASEILGRGKTASWLAALFTLDPSPQICTFPRFPMTSVAGKALVKQVNGDEVEMVTEVGKIPTFRWLDNVPGGTMDKEGYFTFTSAAVRIARVSNTEAPGVNGYSGPKQRSGFMHFAAEDESLWRIHPEASDTQKLDEKPRAFMVFLGMQVGHISSVNEPEPEGDSFVLVIEEHAPERFHRISSFLFWRSFNYLIRQGKDRQFRLGGPEAV